MIQAIITYPLYRRPRPTNKVVPYGYLPEGSVIEVEDILTGDKIDASCIWYKATDGYFYWSGGFENVAFTFPGKEDMFMELSLEQQAEVVSEALDYYYELIEKKVPAFTGMSVTYKQSDSQFREYYALVIQVNKKNGAGEWQIPATLPYHGYLIPTDVVEAQPTFPVGLGQSISRKTMFSFGSAGFIATRQNSRKKVLVTNYHVAFSDLMSNTPRRLAFSKDDPITHPEMVMPSSQTAGAAVFGRVIEGRLDSFNDIALIELDNTETTTNTIEFIGPISGIRTLDEIKQGFHPDTITVQMFGAKSNFRQGFIHAFNARQPVNYLDGDFVHVLKGLIQTTAMSQPGDSGSAVVDTANKLVGILVAGDDKFSYILPIENVLRNFNLNQTL